MTKKANIVFTSVMVSGILLSIAGFCLLFWWAMNVLIDISTTKERFHKPVCIEAQPQKRFSDNQNNVYTFSYEHDVFSRHADGSGVFIEPQVDFGYVGSITTIDACSSDVYIATLIKYYDPDDYESAESIVIYDKNNMDLVKTIKATTGAKAITIVGDSLYCLSYFYAPKTDTDHYEVCKYSFDTFEKETISNNLDLESIFYDGSTALFFQRCNPYQYTYHICDAENGFFLSQRKHFSCYHPGEGVIKFDSDGNKLSIESSNTTLGYEIDFNSFTFYDYVYVIDNYVVFAIKEHIDDTGCVPGHEDCFCHYGRSRFVKYDIVHHSILEPIDYEPQTILIDYDSYGAYYYYNGALFDHGQLIAEHKKIEIEDYIIVRGGEYRSVDTSLVDFVYYDEKIYGAGSWHNISH